MTKNIVTFLVLSRSATRIVKELFWDRISKTRLVPQKSLFSEVGLCKL